MKTDHNLSVLRTHGVDHLTYNELCQLLIQNDPWLLPEVSARGRVGLEGFFEVLVEKPDGWQIENSVLERTENLILITNHCMEETWI